MKKSLIFLMALSLTLLSNMPLKAQSLEELVAPGKKVYVEVVDVKETLNFEDEVNDCNQLTRDEMNWVVVDSVGEADFVLQLSMWRRFKIGFPRCYMKPAILLPNGEKVWEGDEVKADANSFNGYRCTFGAYWKVVRHFKNDPVFAPAVKDDKK